MELGAQIRKQRSGLGLSQEELAERVFVSRQSVSNWENGKTYPDIKSLLLLSETFGVSLDILVKGDIERMKQEIDSQELAQFQKDSQALTIWMVILLLSPIPLAKFLSWLGLAVFLAILAVAGFYCWRVEKYKKKYDIQTYKEILAFTEGKSMDEIEKAREEGKRPYQKVFMAIAAALVAVAVCVLMTWLWV